MVYIVTMTQFLYTKNVPITERNEDNMTSMLTLKGTIKVPGDKSISHRSVMIGSIARGCTTVTNFLFSEDCLSTINCFRNLGVTIEENREKHSVQIYGNGINGLSPINSTMNLNNSGTSIRLISGILCGQEFRSILTGDDSLLKRPMGRILKPLKQMNAQIKCTGGQETAPIIINDSNNGDIPLVHEKTTPKLKAIHYTSPIASAQVKSCLLFAGLYADGITSVTEPYISRNHTEIMLQTYGAKVHVEGTSTSIEPNPILYAQDIIVPGDISSASYFIVAALLVPNSEILLKDVGLNPTRDGILEVCQSMGATIEIENYRVIGGEPVGDLIVRSQPLHGTTISGSIIPRLIDELPIIAIMACFASGDTIIKDATELKVKESNRIDLVVNNLKAMGADITATDDGMIIHGKKQLHAATIKTNLDHRIAMSFAIANLMCEDEIELDNRECVEVSYPGFFEDLQSIIQ